MSPIPQKHFMNYSNQRLGTHVCGHVHPGSLPITDKIVRDSYINKSFIASTIHWLVGHSGSHAQ